MTKTIYPKWKRTKNDTENLLDRAGNVTASVFKHKNDGWRAVVGSDIVKLKLSKGIATFPTIEEAKSAIENIITEELNSTKK